MGEKFTGGELKKECSSDITVEGRSLEEYVFEEAGKELGEQLEPDNLNPYHKGRGRIKPYTESNGKVRTLTRREINKEQWETTIMGASSIDEAFITSLLSGKEMFGPDICKLVLQSVPGATQKKYDMRISYLVHKTDLGKLIEGSRAGKGRSYRLVTAALDCRTEELTTFCYKDHKRDVVLEHHKALRPYFEDDKSQVAKPQEPGKSAPRANQDGVSTGIAGAIETAISQALGVNVNVSGRIVIAFKWE